MSEEQKQFGYVEYLWREEEANKLSGVCYRSNVSQSCENSCSCRTRKDVAGSP